jgi:hypothetical protein
MKHTIKQSYTVTNTYNIEVEPLSKFTKTDNFIPQNLFVVEVTDNQVQEGFESKKSQVKTQAIISQEKLDEVLKNPKTIKDQNLNLDHPIIAAKKGFKEYVTQVGFSSDLDTFLEIPKKTQHDFFVTNILDNKEEINIFQYVQNEQHLRLWKESNNNLFMEPFIFDYIAAQLDNKKYDLDKLVEHLMLRDDVGFTTSIEQNTFSHKRKFLKGPLKGDEAGINNIISNIPGYNQEEGRDESICLVYFPKPEDIEKILGFKASKQYYNVENFIMGEILGANVCLNIPPPQEEAPPKRKFKRN